MAYYIVNRQNDFAETGTWFYEEDGFLEEVKMKTQDGVTDIASFPSKPAVPLEVLRPFIIRVQRGGVDRSNLRY